MNGKHFEANICRPFSFRLFSNGLGSAVQKMIQKRQKEMKLFEVILRLDK